MDKNRYLYLDLQDEFFIVDVAKIVYLESDGNHTGIVFKNRLKTTVCMDLAKMQGLLDDSLKDAGGTFARVGKYHIVNLNYVYQIAILRQKLVLSDGENFEYQISVSEDALKKLRDMYVARLRVTAEKGTETVIEGIPTPEPASVPSKQTAALLSPVGETHPMVQDGEISGHGYVDLGLPSRLKWATCNVGASSPSDYGSYFVWGGTAVNSEYTKRDSSTYGKNIDDVSGNPQYDAARSGWGGTWRMPAKAEMEELLSKCVWTWTMQEGCKGYKVTGSNGHSIFLPAAGWYVGSSLSNAGDSGNYWSSRPCSGNLRYAHYLFFDGNYRNMSWDYRFNGHSVRPVSE